MTSVLSCAAGWTSKQPVIQSHQYIWTSSAVAVKSVVVVVLVETEAGV